MLNIHDTDHNASIMTERLTSQEATKRWKFLLDLQNLKPTKVIASRPCSSLFRTHRRPERVKRTLPTSLPPYSLKKAKSSPAPNPAHDPFDCGSLVILSTHDIVENTGKTYLEEWKKLDDRKINQKSSHETVGANVSSTAMRSDEKASANTNYGGGWRAMENRLWLPDGFDLYTKKSKEVEQLESQADANHSGGLVISSENPNQRLSYSNELSKLFRSIPSCRELEQQARCGHRVNNTLRVYQETNIAEKTSSDSSALFRLRMPNRHGLPQFLTSLPNHNVRNSKRQQNQDSYSQQATVLFEFWRNQPKQPMESGCLRMVIEFLATQTLWDVHVILSQMIEDHLWILAHDDNDPEYDNILREKLSGCFFIENTFYQTGPVDYVKPIIKWIDGGTSSRSNSIRRRYLGIDPSISIKNVKRMKSTKLSQVPFRSNIRYFHACHGDVETSFMLVDRMLKFQEGGGNGIECTKYPLFHDVWATQRFFSVPLCDACQLYQTVYKSSTNCATTDGGPRSLCQECCVDLNVIKVEQGSVKLNRQWQDQAHLSERIAHEQKVKFR